MGRGPFGFSRRTWPFVKVLVGNWLFSIIYYVGMKQVVPWRPANWTVLERLELMIQCSILALVPAVIAIAVVAAQRLNPDMWVGQQVKRYSPLDINTRFILNTVAGADFVELDGRSVSSVQSIQLTDGLFQFTEVPAPGAASLLGLGLCAAARRRR